MKMIRHTQTTIERKRKHIFQSVFNMLRIGLIVFPPSVSLLSLIPLLLCSNSKPGAMPLQ